MNPNPELTLVCPASFRRIESGRKRLISECPESPLRGTPRVAKLMALALRFDRLVRNGSVDNYADLARLGGVSYARMTQIMNLLNLDPSIQEELLFLQRSPDGSDPINEFALRAVNAEIDWSVQRRLWAKIKSPS